MSRRMVNYSSDIMKNGLKMYLVPTLIHTVPDSKPDKRFRLRFLDLTWNVAGNRHWISKGHFSIRNVLL